MEISEQAYEDIYGPWKELIARAVGGGSVD